MGIYYECAVCENKAPLNIYKKIDVYGNPRKRGYYYQCCHCKFSQKKSNMRKFKSKVVTVFVLVEK